MKLGWYWAFPGIGAVLLVCAISLQTLRVTEQAQMLAAQGNIIDLTNGCPTVRFHTQTGEPIIFRGTVCSNPPAFGIDDSVQVLYDPGSPAHAIIDRFLENWFVSLVLGSIGTFVLLVSGFYILPPWVRRWRVRQLQRHGQPVQAQLLEVRRQETLSVNGKHPWRIVAQWQDPATGTLHRFFSEGLWLDPTPYLPHATVRVLIDPKRPHRYSMDTRFIPPLED